MGEEMSANGIHEKIIGEQNAKKRTDYPLTDASQQDKKLAIGTTRFYEDILISLRNSLIIVYNPNGKHIEVWGHPKLKKKYGISTKNLKGVLINEFFDDPEASEIKNQVREVFENNKGSHFRANIHFPAGNFWFEISLSPLGETKGNPKSVIGHLYDISEIILNEKKLRSLNEKLSNIIDHAPDAILIANSKGVTISVNETLLQFSGFQNEDFIGKKLYKLPIFLSEDSVKYQSITQSFLSGQTSELFEVEWKTKNGTLKWGEARGKTIFKKNKITGFQIVLSDITERKEVENDLFKSKQAYKIIVENAHEAIYILQDNQIKFCNAHTLELTNCSMDELLSSSIVDFIHPDDRETAKRIISERFNGRIKQDRFEYRILDKQGNLKWIENTSILIDWIGKPAILIFATDITDKKSAKNKESKYLKSLEFLSEKAMEFAELKTDVDLYPFLGNKIREIEPNCSVLLLSYDYQQKTTHIEHAAGPGEQGTRLHKIVSDSSIGLKIKFNHDFIKNLSYGKIIKYNDGLFELGYNLFPKETYSRIISELDTGDIYIIGLTWENLVYGNVIVFLQKGVKLENPDAIETVVKFGAIALQKRKAKESLRKSEEKYRNIFESFEDIYYKLDIDGNLIEISPSVEKIGGYNPTEVIGKPISHFFTDKGMIKSFTKLLLRNKVISDKDIEFVHKRGMVIEASLTASLLSNPNGHPIGSHGIIRDISDRKKVEKKFQESEEKFRTLADYTYDWEYWITPTGEITYMSPSCERISGYTSDDFVANPNLLTEIIYDDDKEKYFQAHEDKKEENGLPVKVDFRIITKKGKTKWIGHLCQKVFIKNSQYLGIRVSNRDITSRKLAEEKMRASESRFRTLFIESPDAIFVENFDGIILDANPAACKLHGLTKDDLIGKNILDLVPDPMRDQVARDFSKWLNDEITHFEGYSLNANGKSIPVEIHGQKIKYDEKDALLFIVRDISNVKRAEKDLKSAKEKAEESDMLKSIFLANMSHEIRTPMNAIVGFSEILSDQDLSIKERKEFINYITQGSNTLMSLIEDIIDITKIEAGQIKINFAECDVDSMMDELYATFLKMKNKEGKQKVELRLNKPPYGEGLSITTDPSRIRQILSNLLGNALKFTSSGYIELGLVIENPNQVTFYVKDTGIGIPDDKQKLIFERFGQVDDNKGFDSKGTGLGLSISKKLAELLGGDLTVESEEDKGSTFYLNIPVSRKPQKEETKKAPVPALTMDFSSKKFLIAEDSILNYTYLEALFQKTNVKLLWAKDGKEAIEICKKNRDIDLVLMDIKMPVLNGLEAITEIKKFRKDLPIIVQTAYAMPEDRERSIAAGGNEHLTKPLNADELFKTINKYLS
jgi:PAS domain S-box-containing protein